MRTSRSIRTSSSSSHDLSGPLSRPHVALEFPVGQGQGASRPRHRGGPALRGPRSPATAAAAGIQARAGLLRRAVAQARRFTTSVTWLNRNDIIGFNAASLAPAANYTAQEPGDGLHRARHRRAIISTSKALCTTSGRRKATSTSSAICRSSSSSTADNPSVRAPKRTGSAGDRRRARTAPIRSPASGPSTASSRSPTPTACSPRSCRGRSAGRSTPRPASTTSPGSRNG